VHAEHARYTSTLGVKSPYWRSALWPALVGIGSGVFMSPNAAAMQPAHVEAGT
jgi:hypothetical protein